MFVPLQGFLRKSHVCPLPTYPSGVAVNACSCAHVPYVLIWVSGVCAHTCTCVHISSRAWSPPQAWGLCVTSSQSGHGGNRVLGVPQTKKKKDVMWGLRLFHAPQPLQDSRGSTAGRT